MDNEKLVQVAMNVIMHAGDARDYIRKAGTKLSALDLDGVEELLKKASAELVEAHKAQTSVLQNEAEGDSVPMTVLFSHAQDTLMTVESEQYMISILYQERKVSKRVSFGEERRQPTRSRAPIMKAAEGLQIPIS